VWECWYDEEAGLKFSVKQRGTQDELRDLFGHAQDFVGKLLTVRYQSRMANGCPEFGVGIELDRRDLPMKSRSGTSSSIDAASAGD